MVIRLHSPVVFIGKPQLFEGSFLKIESDIKTQPKMTAVSFQWSSNFLPTQIHQTVRDYNYDTQELLPLIVHSHRDYGSQLVWAKHNMS